MFISVLLYPFATSVSESRERDLAFCFHLIDRWVKGQVSLVRVWVRVCVGVCGWVWVFLGWLWVHNRGRSLGSSSVPTLQSLICRLPCHASPENTLPLRSPRQLFHANRVSLFYLTLHAALLTFLPLNLTPANVGGPSVSMSLLSVDRSCQHNGISSPLTRPTTTTMTVTSRRSQVTQCKLQLLQSSAVDCLSTARYKSRYSTTQLHLHPVLPLHKKAPQITNNFYLPG